MKLATTVDGTISANCLVIYRREDDSITIMPAVDGFPVDYTKANEAAPKWRQEPGVWGVANGAVIAIDNGVLYPAAGVNNPTSPTFYNPLLIEALEHLLDAFPKLGRWPLQDAPAGFGLPGYKGTAWDFLTSVENLRADYATIHGKTAGISFLDLYHGTAGLYADKIVREGLQPRDTTGVDNHWSDAAISHEGLVYLAHPSRLSICVNAMRSAMEVALKKLYGAEHAYELKGDAKARAEVDPRVQAVLLRVRVPSSAFVNFESDEDEANYAGPVSEMTGMPEWMGSIGAMGVVAYRGSIPASWISVAERGEAAMKVNIFGNKDTSWRTKVASSDAGSAWRGIICRRSGDDYIEALRNGTIDQYGTELFESVATRDNDFGAKNTGDAQGMGVHWTFSRSKAEQFAIDVNLWADFLDGAIPLLVEADYESDYVSRDPDGEFGGAYAYYSTGEPNWKEEEFEVMLRGGAPLIIKNVYIGVPKNKAAFIKQYDNSDDSHASTKGCTWHKITGLTGRTVKASVQVPLVATVERLTAGLPRVARDGDCITVSEMITAGLQADGFPDAETVDVVGWVQDNLMGFLHRATKSGDVIIDATATQFDISLPMPWIVSEDSYCAMLAGVTGVSSVKIGWV